MPLVFLLVAVQMLKCTCSCFSNSSLLHLLWFNEEIHFFLKSAVTFTLWLNVPSLNNNLLSVSANSSSVKLQLQATSVGEVVIKGICANRYLAMNRDGRLFGAVSDLDRSFHQQSLCCFCSIKDLANLYETDLIKLTALWQEALRLQCFGNQIFSSTVTRNPPILKTFKL